MALPPTVTTFKKATRTKVKLKLGITGPSGSGKTEGALHMARQLVGTEGRIALADTENDSASLYADRHEFDTLSIGAPYLSKKFTEAIDAAVEAKYDLLIIDSLTHQWAGAGGILDRKAEEERRNPKLGFALWAKYKDEHRRFMAHLLAAPIHIISCLRAKQEHVQEGSKVIKLGLAPVTGEDAEYEFSVLFELNMEHRAHPSKDRSRLFDGRTIDLITDKPGRSLAEWLAAGNEPEPPQRATVDTKHDAAGEAVLRSFLADRLITDAERTQMEAWMVTPRSAPEIENACKRLDGLIEKRKTTVAVDTATA